MADYKVPPFLRRDGDALIFNDEGELIFYVPEVYFDRGDALIVGEYVNLVGMFDYSIFDKNGKNNGLHRFFFPSVFLAKPYAMDKQKKVKLTKSQPEADYRLLRFKKGDAVVVSVVVPTSTSNIDDFYRIFLYGKLPTTIPVETLQDYFIENADINNASYGMSLQMFGFVIGESVRDAKDLYKPFRLTDYTDSTSYKMLSLVDLPKYISPYQAINSLNWDNAVVGAMNNTSEIRPPLEKLLMD